MMFQTSGTLRASIFWRQTHVMSGTVASNPRVPTRRLAVKASRTDLTWPGEQRHDPCFLNGHVRCIYIYVYIYGIFPIIYGMKNGLYMDCKPLPKWDAHPSTLLGLAHILIH